VTRVVYGAFITFAAAFVLSSVWQISSQLFGFGSASRPEARHVGPTCATSIAAAASAIEVARAAPVQEPELPPDEAADLYRKQRGALDQAKLEPCGADPAGADALAALARYDRAAEASVRRRAVELGPVRREVLSFIK
jgi:hypothetical protein